MDTTQPQPEFCPSCGDEISPRNADLHGEDFCWKIDQQTEGGE